VATCTSGKYYEASSGELICTPQCPPVDFSGAIIVGQQDRLFLNLAPELGKCVDSYEYVNDNTPSGTPIYTYSLTFNGVTKIYASNTSPPTDPTSRNGGTTPTQPGVETLDLTLFLTTPNCSANCALLAQCPITHSLYIRDELFTYDPAKYKISEYSPPNTCFASTCPSAIINGSTPPKFKVAGDSDSAT
jgi:hypothetical protein